MSAAERAESEAVLVRHAETEWSASGRYTGLADVPLNDSGRERARALAATLARWRFELVLVSPAQRARETCELAGLGAHASVRDDLHEWDYGEYEGMTRAQIERLRPGWKLWRDGAPRGESAAEVGARADRVVGELILARGEVAVFSHGHMLRVLGARWIEQEPALGERLCLQTASISILGREHGTRALRCWSAATS